MKQKIPKGLLNQAEYARKMNISKQRMHYLVIEGDLMTKRVGKRLLLVNNSYNDDLIKERCCGRGNYNHISYNY